MRRPSALALSRVVAALALVPLLAPTRLAALFGQPLRIDDSGLAAATLATAAAAAAPEPMARAAGEEVDERGAVAGGSARAAQRTACVR